MASIPQLESCCCGCSLKTGSKFIGWLHLVGSILATFTMGSGLAAIYYVVDHPELNTPEAKEIRENFTFLRAFAILLILLYLASCALAFVLLLGVYQSKSNLVIIWVAASLTMAVMEVLIEVLQFVFIYNPSQLITFVFFFINLYLILVVYSFYRSIRNVSSNYA